MNLLEMTVSHHQFGTGTIVVQTDTVIEVVFPHPWGNRKFLYPAAFSSHLQLADPELRHKLMEELEQEEALKLQRRQHREELILRQLAEKQEALAKQKKSAARRTTRKTTKKTEP